MSHMDVAVGIGGPVMKYPFGMSIMKFLFLFVNFIFFPIFQKIRFALGQVAPHGKLCFRQIQRFAVIHFLLLLNWL